MKNTRKTTKRLWVLAGFVLLFLPLQIFAAETVLKTVSANEFFTEFERLEGDGDAVVIDVRTPEEYASGHAGDALNIDFYDKDFRQSLDALDKESAYFIYCRSGSRSGRTLSLMKDLGFTRVYDLAGGWSRNSARLSEIEGK
ncbi:MAG: rhodanese-like domain-containing protein [Spirochaetaceae bacterium]|nr:rhodanese-like domain-containing protein [Spirochaetaceae bacterium]MDT8299077.1 rhodanese-like domain-containing protein [Spirochaetaceae bacterium]